MCAAINKALKTLQQKVYEYITRIDTKFSLRNKYEPMQNFKVKEVRQETYSRLIHPNMEEAMNLKGYNTGKAKKTIKIKTYLLSIRSSKKEDQTIEIQRNNDYYLKPTTEVDIKSLHLSQIKSGNSPIQEENLYQILAENHKPIHKRQRITNKIIKQKQIK